MSDLTDLKREELSIQAISAMTGFDRKTVRKYLLRPGETPAAVAALNQKLGTLL